MTNGNHFWKAWGYDIQGAIYQEVVRQNTGILLPFGLAVATKEKPEPDIALIELPIWRRASRKIVYGLGLCAVERFH